VRYGKVAQARQHHKCDARHYASGGELQPDINAKRALSLILHAKYIIIVGESINAEFEKR